MESLPEPEYDRRSGQLCVEFEKAFGGEQYFTAPLHRTVGANRSEYQLFGLEILGTEVKPAHYYERTEDTGDYQTDLTETSVG